MVDKLTLFFVFINFSAMLLVSFLSITNPLKVNVQANTWFGLFLLLWASFWIDEVLLFFFNYELTTFWQLAFRYLQYHAPLFFYFSIAYYAHPHFKLKKEIAWHLMHSVLYLVLLFAYYYSGFYHVLLQYALMIIMLIQSTFYICASYFRIQKHQKNVVKFSSNTLELDLSWLKRIIYGIALILAVVIVYNIFFTFETLSLWVNIFIMIIVFDVAYHSIKQKEIFPFSEAAKEDILALEEETELEEQKKKIVSDEELILLKNQLDQFMNKEKPYLDPELNLVKLASLFETTPHRLSYIINSGFDRNFFNFINQYRVNEAKSLLLNPKMEQFSLLGIAYEAGFSSKTSFNNAFKKITGLTPSDFKKSGSTL